MGGLIPREQQQQHQHKQQGVNPMEYMLGNLMRKIDQNNGIHAWEANEKNRSKPIPIENPIEPSSENINLVDLTNDNVNVITLDSSQIANNLDNEIMAQEQQKLMDQLDQLKKVTNIKT